MNASLHLQIVLKRTRKTCKCFNKIEYICNGLLWLHSSQHTEMTRFVFYISRLKLHTWNAFIFSCLWRVCILFSFCSTMIIVITWLYVCIQSDLKIKMTRLLEIAFFLRVYLKIAIQICKEKKNYLILWNNNLLNCNFGWWSHFPWKLRRRCIFISAMTLVFFSLLLNSFDSMIQ